MRRLMRDEWQSGLGQVSSLQRHPKPEISAGHSNPVIWQVIQMGAAILNCCGRPEN